MKQIIFICFICLIPILKSNPLPAEIPISPKTISDERNNNDNIINKSIAYYSFLQYEKDPCLEKPSDDVPDYDPDSDRFKCWEKYQLNSNCYNYATNIITNSKAEIGRWGGYDKEVDDCTMAIKAVQSDGLIYIGYNLKRDRPDKGHYVVMFYRMNSLGFDWHFLRLDSNGLWSEKKGDNPVNNKDLFGNVIYDVTYQDRKSYHEFCGFFQVIPSLVNIR